jgi:hypothetical protein
MPCSPLKFNWRFRETCCLHLQGRKVSQARNQREASSKLHAGLLLGLFFDPDEGSNMFIWNVGWLSVDFVLEVRKNSS